MKTVFYGTVVALLALASGPVLAAFIPGGDSGSGGSVSLANPLSCPDFNCVLGSIAKFLYWISFPIVTIIILWAAFLFLTAGGKEEQIRHAVRTLQYAGIGFMILLIAGGIPFIIKEILGSK